MGRLAHVCHVIKPGKTLSSWLASGKLTITSVSMCHFNQTSNGGVLLWNPGQRDTPHQQQRCGLMHQGHGCGVISLHLYRWIQQQCSSYNHAGFNLRNQSILWKELVSIVLVCMVWLKHWQGLSMIVHCDNMGAVVVFNTEHNCERPNMHLLLCLFFIRATNQFSLCTTHTSGVQNSWANALF